MKDRRNSIAPGSEKGGFPSAFPEGSGLRLSSGETHYLWWFIQGSIMSPPTRSRLRKAWGFCGRHAWGAILVEASFRHGYMHGPAILYEDILGIALLAFPQRSLLKNRQLRLNLRSRGPCLMCEMNLGPHSRGMASPDIVRRGQDPTELRIFCERTREFWEKAVCGRCSGDESWPRCRPHLIQDAANGSPKNLLAHREHLDNIYHHLTLYSRSFRWEFQGTETKEDEAALISAVGWCSGWQPLLSILGVKK